MPITNASARHQDCCILERQYVEKATHITSLSAEDFYSCVRKSLDEIDPSEKRARLETTARHAAEWATEALKNGEWRLASFHFQLGRAATELLEIYSRDSQEVALCFPKVSHTDDPDIVHMPIVNTR